LCDELRYRYLSQTAERFEEKYEINWWRLFAPDEELQNLSEERACWKDIKKNLKL
jgi:hypothetical protein